MWDDSGAAGRCYEHLGPGLTPNRKGLAMKATRVCAAPQCDVPVLRRQWCTKHYQRWHQRGTLVAKEPVSVDSRPGEEWRAVVGFEGLYEVSDHGRVKSLRHVIPRLLRASSDRYPKVNLHGNGTRSVRVHILVLTAFVGPAPDGMECLHADDDGHNNCLTNLRWGTHSENGDDRWDLHRKRDGDGFKLTADQVREIHVALAGGEHQKVIAARYGTSRGNISHIARGSTWAHLHPRVLPRAEQAS